MPPVPMATTSTTHERARDDVTVIETPASEPARWRLVSLSLLMFFVELALIRWTAANNVHLAYITNFVLLASFLGIGVGFLLAGSRRELFRWAPVALAALVAFVLAFPVKLVTLTGPHPFESAFGLRPLPKQVSLPVIFGLVVVVMAGIGQAMARAFARFKPLEAYRLDIVGSLGGIALFSVMAFLRVPPVAAAELDPVLVQPGGHNNPEHAYQSPRVTLHVDDGRAFLQNSHGRYDLILFALPDSLTALAGQSELRLENYLFTIQAMRVARAHLEAGGAFAMYNYYQPFLLDRYATTLHDVYGSRPCAELGATLGARRQAVLTVAREGATSNCATPWQGLRSAPASDDRPFPYLPTPSIPIFYLWVIGL